MPSLWCVAVALVAVAVGAVFQVAGAVSIGAAIGGFTVIAFETRVFGQGYDVIDSVTYKNIA